jgi:hypothetical protein
MVEALAVMKLRGPQELGRSLLAQSVRDLSHECAGFDSKPISEFHDTSESGINKTTFQLADIGIAITHLFCQCLLGKTFPDAVRRHYCPDRSFKCVGLAAKGYSNRPRHNLVPFILA